jgi:hypothetical protein
MLRVLHSHGYIIPARLSRSDLMAIADTQVKQFFSASEQEKIRVVLGSWRLQCFLEFYWGEYKHSAVLPLITAVELSEHERECLRKTLEYLRTIRIFVHKTYLEVRKFPSSLSLQ